MRHLAIALALVVAAAALPAWAQDGSLPFPSGETLYYNVNWPSGLSLGEGQLSARFEPATDTAPGQWRFQFQLQAAIPVFEVNDTLTSAATAALCSLSFERHQDHGGKSIRERTEFDLSAGNATRETLDGGGSSQLQTGSCPQDALTFIYSVRDQLARGRIPPAQTVYYGAGYDMRLEYLGTETVQIGSDPIPGERLGITIDNTGSPLRFEVVFEASGARRPLRVQVPFDLGSFTMELQP